MNRQFAPLNVVQLPLVIVKLMLYFVLPMLAFSVPVVGAERIGCIQMGEFPWSSPHAAVFSHAHFHHWTASEAELYSGDRCFRSRNHYCDQCREFASN